MADGAREHPEPTWETGFNAAFDRICATFWGQIAARAEQTQQSITYTTQPQAEFLSANSPTELTHPAMHMENVPLQRQPYTRGFIRELEAPRAHDPQNRIHGTTARVPFTAAGRRQLARRLRKTMSSRKRPTPRPVKRPPAAEECEWNGQGPPSWHEDLASQDHRAIPPGGVA
ncbi:Hypothetical predicted protein [Pelobates cultripes]|uniref:Uncharacterized protein n=1 Tax=Pelobates cultripes TaxID=61616 RepID=A0AAD1RH25_PELCU|nr:Hypothetical predicted protein [Pelobates cultripes]